jgi:hypothetical protein
MQLELLGIVVLNPDHFRASHALTAADGRDEVDLAGLADRLGQPQPGRLGIDDHDNP